MDQALHHIFNTLTLFGSYQQARILCLAAGVATAAVVSTVNGDAVADDGMSAKLDRLIAAYPAQHLKRDGLTLIWPDGTTMAFDDGRGEKTFREWIAAPDLEDTFSKRYRAFTPPTPPAKNDDPGRARVQPFLQKMYGDCRKGGVKPQLTTITWLPKKSGQKLRVTKVNGVAAKLQAVSDALDALPAKFDKFLIPSAGTYNCRVISGTSRVSAHSYAIAIDIAIKETNYWRWSKPQADGTYPYKNKIPQEIVEIFETHGFIWGGRWYHYDTMHFEYRPELIPQGAAER